MENQIVDHLSLLEDSQHVENEGHVCEKFPKQKLLALEIAQVQRYVDIVNFLVSGLFTPEAPTYKKQRLKYDERFYILDYPYLFSCLGNVQII